MKAIKLSFVALVTLILGTVFFIACSSDEENKEETNSKELNSVSYRITNGAAFISSFYGTSSWSTGEKITTADSLTTYEITEIIVGAGTRARGYLVKDHNTGDLLYFADVDRSKYILKTVDLITEEQETIRDITAHPDYSSTDEFDFINIIEKDNYVTYGGRFWGWSCGAEYSIEPGSCYRNCVYYVIWKAVPTELTAYPEPVFSCGNLPGRNPKLN